jgi:hypothetical protein
MQRSSNDPLRDLLPTKESEYDFDRLSAAETDALEAALADGFGDVGATGYRPMPPPSEIHTGLLRHRYFVSPNSEYDPEEYPNEFWDWRGHYEDQPPPASDFPLRFVIWRIRLYFANQLDRFCAQIIRDDPTYETVERELLKELAADRLYEKPWYEFHALQLINWMDPEIYGTSTKNLPFLFSSSWCGKLGRLVEQYYWKFRFERAAITGIGSRAGASSGGKAKAKLHKAERAKWQKEAAEIWTSRPKLTKAAVAKAIKARLGVSQSAKHIARFIKQP